MINFDDLDHPYRILIIRGSGSGKTNLLFNLISQQLYFYKTYIHAKDPYEAKYQQRHKTFE